MIPGLSLVSQCDFSSCNWNNHHLVQALSYRGHTFASSRDIIDKPDLVRQNRSVSSCYGRSCMPGIYVNDNFSLSVLSVEDDTPRFYGMTVQTWGICFEKRLKWAGSHNEHTFRGIQVYLRYSRHSGNTNLEKSHVDVRSERERRW